MAPLTFAQSIVPTVNATVTNDPTGLYIFGESVKFSFYLKPSCANQTPPVPSTARGTASIGIHDFRQLALEQCFRLQADGGVATVQLDPD